MGFFHSLCCSSHCFNMVPTLSTLRLPSALSKITLAQLIVIVTLLPFSFQSKHKDSQLVIYSNGPCLVIRFFESELTDFTPSFPSLRPLEVPLKVAGKNCSQNDPGWITSISHYMDPVTLDFHLIWADSDSQTLWTGRVNSTNYHISDVKQLRDNNSNLIGSRVRSLIFDSGKLFISLPYLHRIEMYDLIDGLSIAQQKSKSSVVNLNRTVLLADNDKIGKVLYNQNVNKLFWIEGNKCLWSGTPSSQGIENKKVLLCNNHLSDEVIYSAVIDPDSDDIYVFYEKGKIECLSGPNWSQRTTVITNCLAEEKYKDAKFYTIKMIKEKQFLRFYASDTQHYAFRQISLIKRFETGQNDEGDIDEYILDIQNSGILFTDAPNIYDFIFPEDKRSKSRVIGLSKFQGDKQIVERKSKHQTISSLKQSDETFVTESLDELKLPQNENSVTKISQNSDLEPADVTFPSSAKYRSVMKPTLELINEQDLPDSSSKPIRKLELPIDNLDTINPLSKIIVSSSSSSPVENLPPQITLLTVTSSSTIIYWLFAFLSIGIVIAGLWVLATLIGLKRNYKKVYSDDNSLNENLTSVKY